MKCYLIDKCGNICIGYAIDGSRIIVHNNNLFKIGDYVQYEHTFYTYVLDNHIKDILYIGNNLYIIKLYLGIGYPYSFDIINYRSSASYEFDYNFSRTMTIDHYRVKIVKKIKDNTGYVCERNEGIFYDNLIGKALTIFGSILGICTSRSKDHKQIYVSVIPIYNFLEGGPINIHFVAYHIKDICNNNKLIQEDMKYLFHTQSKVYYEGCEKIFNQLFFNISELKKIYKNSKPGNLQIVVLRRFIALKRLYNLACEFKAYIYRPITSDDESTGLVRKARDRFTQYQ